MRRGPLLKSVAASDGSPSAASNAATSGYDYSSDHLLFFGPPSPHTSTRTHTSKALARRTTYRATHHKNCNRLGEGVKQKSAHFPAFCCGNNIVYPVGDAAHVGDYFRRGPRRPPFVQTFLFRSPQRKQGRLPPLLALRAAEPKANGNNHRPFFCNRSGQRGRPSAGSTHSRRTPGSLVPSVAG